jgi:predicted nucleic acid-binding Zn ribbon protein
MKQGQTYRCQNRDCGCEVQVLKASIEASANPRCRCGAEMKKPYEKPVFNELDSKAAIGMVGVFRTKN